MTTTIDRPTLVLNRDWLPVGVATVARSLALVATDRARVVDPETFTLHSWSEWTALKPAADEPAIVAVSFRMRVPEVVALARYDRVPRQVVAFSRRNIFRRDRNTCQYCGKRPAADELSIDHVVPRSRGGTSTWENCVLACLGCNRRKADRTPREAGMRLRVMPVRPSWQPMYAPRVEWVTSWSKFVSDAYWNAELDT
jgi:5-methylcytosine-specific restriction endonuclease McrA